MKTTIRSQDVLGPANGQVAPVLASLQQALGGLAGQIPDPGLAGALGFFGALAGWAGTATGVDERLVERDPELQALVQKARALVDGSAAHQSLGELLASLVQQRTNGSAEAGDVLQQVLAQLDAVELGLSEADGSTQSPAAAVPAAEIANVSSYLGKHHPGEEVTVASVSAITGGFSKLTILVSYTVGERAEEVVLRQVPPGQSSDELKPEYDVLKAVWSPHLPICEPLWIEEGQTELGGPFFASRRAQGTPVGSVQGATGPVAAGVITGLAGVLAALHQQDPATLAPTPAPDMRSSQLIAVAIDDLERRTLASVSEVPPRVSVILAWLRANVVEPSKASIVHGDAGFQNLLAADGELTALLDWERAHVGDAAEDLAYVKPFVEPVADWDQFLDEYVARGGERPSEKAIEFYTVWQDAWRGVECIRLGVDFASSRRLEMAIAGFVLGPEFLRSAVRTALGATHV